MSVDREMSPSTASSSAVSPGSAATLRMNPAARRPRLSPPLRPFQIRQRCAVASWVTRCTSIDPDSAVVVTPTPGENSWAQRPRRLAPSTSWVALTPRAKASRASGMSVPTTW